MFDKNQKWESLSFCNYVSKWNKEVWLSMKNYRLSRSLPLLKYLKQHNSRAIVKQ